MSRSIDHSFHRYSTSHIPTDEHLQAISMKRRLDGLGNDEIKIKNRVNLLEKEQKRILMKVEETRARATRIKHIKETSEQNYREKMQLKQMKEEEIQENQLRNFQIKAQAQKRREETLRNVFE